MSQLHRLKETLQWLRENNYVDVIDNTYHFTQPFFIDLVKANNEETGLVPVRNQLTKGLEPIDWMQAFIKFIQDAQVPTKMENSKLEVYYVNRYNDPAMKVFRKMVEKEQIQYEILVRSTALYYASTSKFKKTIANYIVQGDWRTDYNIMLGLVQKSVDSKDITELTNHIKSETTDGTHTGYRIG